MNERIRELAGRALDQAVPETWSTLTGEQLGRFQEVFAELIVRECANVTNSLIVTDGKEFPMKSVAYRLKQHFGVEE